MTWIQNHTILHPILNSQLSLERFNDKIRVLTPLKMFSKMKTNAN